LKERTKARNPRSRESRKKPLRKRAGTQKKKKRKIQTFGHKGQSVWPRDCAKKALGP